MLMPRKVKHRKMHRGSLPKGNAQRGTTVSYGSYGIKAATPGLITARQIESARRTITRYMQRTGKYWIRIFPDHPMTKKGDETPMGKGKGAVDYYVVKVKPGKILFEVDGIDEKVAREAFRLAGNKFGIKTRFVAKHNE
ncbi:MAG: 50S ribosomal protein L16 [Candidatus Moraniibacteriota bacterium]|nr:MAG: 50S ribosomal protein L16 [Candidatus Moranbacteria bacterium]